MNRFTKHPLYTNKNKIMKNIKLTGKLILTAVIALFLFLGIAWITLYTVVKLTIEPLRAELNDTKTAYEQAIQPSELEALVEELELNRISRQDDQKQIDKIVEAKKKKAERADEIQERISELTWVK